MRLLQHSTTRDSHPWCVELFCWLSFSFTGVQVPPPLPSSQRTSHVRTTCSFDQLQVNAQEYFRSGLADSTHRTYTAAQRQFLSFCDTYGLSPLPASEDTLILFVTHLAARIKPQSISVYLAGIRSLHVANGYSNPLLPGLRLKQTLRGIERKHFTSPRQKMPITFHLLCKIHPFVNFLSSDVNSHQSPTGEHYWTVRLKQSKTDQRHEGVMLYMSHTNHVVCPACSMKSNVALQQSRPRTPKDSPLFLLEHQQVLTRQHLVTFVSHLLRLVGIDPTAYSGHSFRIGGATSASLAGLKDYEIQMLGRWKSDCYKTYVRSPLNVLLQFPQRIAKTASITYQYANPYYQNTQDY